MKKLVVVGDNTDHGGTIITTTSKVRTSSGMLAVEGSLHDCPQRGHGVTPMKSISGASAGSSGGKMLVTGDVSGCGALVFGSASVGYKG